MTKIFLTSIIFRNCFANLFFLAVFGWHTDFAQAGNCQTLTSEQNQAEALDKLFGELPSRPLRSPKHTFVFFNHGAADHYVPERLDFNDLATISDGKHVRADAVDEKRIHRLALQCPSCNVVILHTQIGGSQWYVSNKGWATYLRVFSQNKKLISRHVRILNGADPKVVTQLLQFSEGLFPQSELHFIYRGHSFLLPYTAENTNFYSVRPFDENFPETPYSRSDFLKSLEQAHLNRPLATLSFAACAMEDTSFNQELSQYTQRVIATSRDVTECPLSHGFNFEFIKSTSNQDTSQIIGDRISDKLFSRGFLTF